VATTKSRSTNQFERTSTEMHQKYPGMIAPLETKEISETQLAQEIKAIYRGLVALETQCTKVIQAQTAWIETPGNRARTLSGGTWKKLLTCHYSLLKEHCDFLLATQHPVSPSSSKRLVTKYSMLARMWKHGIHSLLELLRHQLPTSYEFMLHHIYQSYQMLALLYEIVPAFQDVIAECLGDISRYRFAVEQHDKEVREIWRVTASNWYSIVVNKTPKIGRLYHHLAILAWPNDLKQLCLFCQSLTAAKPFNTSRESFQNFFENQSRSDDSTEDITRSFTNVHAKIFTGNRDDAEELASVFLDHLGAALKEAERNWGEIGEYMAFANIACLFEYGSNDAARAYFEIEGASGSPSKSRDEGDEVIPQSCHSSTRTIPIPQDTKTVLLASTLFRGTFEVVMSESIDGNMLPFIHIVLAFLTSLLEIQIQRQMDEEPWFHPDSLLRGFTKEILCSYLNQLSHKSFPKPVDSEQIPYSGKNWYVPLPEDYSIRGQFWYPSYFPDDWFDTSYEREDISQKDHNKERFMRIFWHGLKLAKVC
jgi:Est1-like DNA/RNA binding protein